MMPFFSEPEHQPFVLGDGTHGVLLIHGFPGTPAELRPLANHLADAGYSAHGMLLPGFGPDISNLKNYDRFDWLRAVRRYWQDEMHIYDTKTLLGYSMGGAMALNLANELNPDRLVLLAPFYRFGGWQWRLLPILKRLKSNIAPFENADFTDAALRKRLSEILPGADLDNPAVQESIRTEITLPLGVVDEVRKLGQHAYRTANQVKIQTLIMQGTLDATVLPKYTQQLVERLAGHVQYLTIEAGHEFVKPGEAREAYWQPISDYLGQQTETLEV